MDKREWKILNPENRKEPIVVIPKAEAEERERKLVEALKAKIQYHRQAYNLNIFPSSETLTDKSSRDAISAYMGRHMCDCFMTYIDEALKELGYE